MKNRKPTIAGSVVIWNGRLMRRFFQSDFFNGSIAILCLFGTMINLIVLFFCFASNEVPFSMLLPCFFAALPGYILIGIDELPKIFKGINKLHQERICEFETLELKAEKEYLLASFDIKNDNWKDSKKLYISCDG